MKLQNRCPSCNKVVEINLEHMTGKMRIQSLSCGHMRVDPVIKSAAEEALDNFGAQDGRKLFDFQKETVKFMREAQGRCILNLEMGLGKTICALAFVHLHPETLPALVVTKSKITRQWFAECFRWTGRVAQVISSSRENPYPEHFEIGIISVDLLTSMSDKLENKYKTLIIDECQTIKNPTAQRTQAAQSLAACAKHVIPMSGTPIKNNLAEFFVTFNMVDPATYNTYSNFVRDWVDSSLGPSFFGGKTVRLGGIIPYRQAKWERETKRFLIRKTRDEVMPDLPKKFRSNDFTVLDDKVAEEYLKELAAFSEYYQEILDSGKGWSMAARGNILGFMSKLRRITGSSKAEYASEWIERFLESTDRPLAVFTHHVETRDRLREALKAAKIEPIMITQANKNQVQQNCVEYNWVTPHPLKDRVAILSTLADGEGLNLQACCDVLMVEHQWNPANEEQAEDRFPRPGTKAEKINVTYLVATGTIDEFLVKIKEHKRASIKTAHGEKVNWDEAEILQQLAQMLLKEGKNGFRGMLQMKEKRVVNVSKGSALVGGAKGN